LIPFLLIPLLLSLQAESLASLQFHTFFNQ
jgi:hypothetical protein